MTSKGFTTVLVAVAVAFVAFATFVPDPTRSPRVYPVGDRRANRYGSSTYAQVSAIISQLRAQRDAASSPEERALLSVRLADIFAARQMYAEARDEIDRAEKLAPTEPAVLVRAALIHHGFGDDAAAAALLRRAERAAPGSPAIARARDIIDGVTPQAQAARGPVE